MTRIRQKTVIPYLISVAVTVAAVSLQYYLTHSAKVVGAGILYPCAFLLAWFFGFGPALCSALLGALLVDYYFFEPKYSFWINDSDEAIRLALYVGTSALAAMIVSRGRKAAINLLQSQERLEESVELFRKVADERDQSLDVLETINSVGKSLSAELEMESLVQRVTDAATRLSKAELGAFFHKGTGPSGPGYFRRSSAAGAGRGLKDFELPARQEVFGPSTDDTKIMRIDDIAKGPIRSYLAVPVFSRSGEVMGDLFFGHSRAAVFSEREERIVAGLASQAAIAMDNARLYERANQAIRIRDEFMSISSHELRTPLTPLTMQLQGISKLLVKGDAIDVDRLKRMVAMSERQVSRLTALIEDLLDVSRISSGKLTLNFEEIDVVEVIREIVERYQPQLSTVKCEARVESLPTLHARLDRLRFEQIVINLLTNAMRYAPGQPLFVTLSQDDGCLVLQVRDQGIGISADDQKRIFDRFERVQSSTSYGGLGLGLYIAHQIVEAHGGEIRVESKLGEGAIFTVRLPLQPGHKAA